MSANNKVSLDIVKERKWFLYIVEKQLYGENVSVYEDAGQRLITNEKYHHLVKNSHYMIS